MPEADAGTMLGLMSDPPHRLRGQKNGLIPDRIPYAEKPEECPRKRVEGTTTDINGDGIGASPIWRIETPKPLRSTNQTCELRWRHPE